MPSRPKLIQAIVLFVILVICLTAIGIGHFFWRELVEDEPVSSVLRNLGLLAGVPIAIVLALWRSAIASWQASAAYKQVETALQQTAIAQEGLLRNRFQRAAEMLGHDSIAVRIGGVQSLAELAAQHMDQYYVTVANLLEAFAMSSIGSDESTDRIQASRYGDIQVARDAVEFLRRLSDKGVKRIEMEQMQDLLPY